MTAHTTGGRLHAFADLLRSDVVGGLLLIGGALAALVALVGGRVIAAAPKSSPKRGVVALGVTPVAFLGVGAVFTARLVSTVVV